MQNSQLARRPPPQGVDARGGRPSTRSSAAPRVNVVRVARQAWRKSRNMDRSVSASGSPFRLYKAQRILRHQPWALSLTRKLAR
jgi:hypothetical protein